MIRKNMRPAEHICISTEKEVSDPEAIEIAKCKTKEWSEDDFANSKVFRISGKDYSFLGYDTPSVKLHISDEWFAIFQRLTGIKDLDCDDIADYIWKLLETKAAESDYDISSTLSLSTHHLKEETFQKLLWSLFRTTGVIRLCYGWGRSRLWISDDPSDYFSGKSIPRDLWKCIRFANKLGCQWICFSEDYEEVSGLSLYN